MDLTVIILQIILQIIAGVSLGTSQLVSLTRNPDSGVTICPGEEVTYTCTADTLLGRLQWIAPPYVIDTNIRRVVDNNVNNEGNTITIGETVIRYVSNNPFVSTLTLNEATAEISTNVICSTIGQNPDSTLRLPYTINNGIVEGVTGLNVVLDTNSTSNESGFSFMVTFNASPSPDIVRYTVSCSDNNCQEFNVTGSSGIIMDYGRCRDNISCNVSVRAINRCGNESTSVAEIVQGPVISPHGIVLVEADDDGNFFRSRIVGSFTPSATPNISRYLVNCTDSEDNACEGLVVEGTVNSFMINVSSSCSGITYSISICAVDRDGRMSRTVTRSVRVKEIRAYCGFVVAFTFCASFLVASLITIIVLSVWIWKLRQKVRITDEKELQNTEYSREEKL